MSAALRLIPLLVHEPRNSGPVTFAELCHARRLLREHGDETCRFIVGLVDAFGEDRAIEIARKLQEQGWLS